MVSVSSARVSVVSCAFRFVHSPSSSWPRSQLGQLDYSPRTEMFDLVIVPRQDSFILQVPVIAVDIKNHTFYL
ncbi:hypothetical protein L226DRAFT_531430 [Lentinus tigrinus ALCF2SS1-7]|uniref:Uncharacterized protein n=1 Tax=Lentinus tigrinus ALCF2SS1-6 TaxID=1328759 RepID=A0A5C2RRZ8_9APHY|nr:hypothetical protein L227DRAFT_581117 [Lentinus tigrinus ALCF2SS1-6]RPD79686.1 hypothetical protein L226DRAFT_531430 [Lentinus tigrinus ALCF2SS1-7]